MTAGDSTAELPKPTRASEELPDDETVRTAGIDLPLAMARMLCVVFSHFIARSRSKDPKHPYDVMRLVAYTMSLEIVRYGKTLRAPHPDLPARGWPASGFKWLPVDQSSMRAYWLGARNRAVDASLPLSWI